MKTKWFELKCWKNFVDSQEFNRESADVIMPKWSRLTIINFGLYYNRAFGGLNLDAGLLGLNISLKFFFGGDNE